MSFRLNKRIKISKGLGLNISKSGIIPSYRTKRGSLSSKGYSIRTGIPGLSYRKTFKKAKNSGCLAVFLLLGLLIMIVSCENEKTKNSEFQENFRGEEIINVLPRTKKWYQGGILHKAKITDWKNASDQNKLATCGDFCAKIYSNHSLDEIKIKAIDLMICVDEAIKEHNAADSFAVSEVASMCLVLLEN